jgi:hypothetical protein
MKQLPKPALSRLEAVTTTAASAITKLESELTWYKSALLQKSLVVHELQYELDECRRTVHSLRFWLTFALIACATSLALRWL